MTFNGRIGVERDICWLPCVLDKYKFGVLKAIARQSCSKRTYRIWNRIPHRRPDGLRTGSDCVGLHESLCLDRGGERSLGGRNHLDKYSGVKSCTAIVKGRESAA